jgi:hypothetical protein
VFLVSYDLPANHDAEYRNRTLSGREPAVPFAAELSLTECVSTERTTKSRDKPPTYTEQFE